MPAVAVGGRFDGGGGRLEGGELQKEVAVGSERVGEIEGTGFFEETLADGTGIEHGLAEGDVFESECFFPCGDALPAGLPEALADLMHGFGGTSQNLGGGIFFYGVAVGGECAFGKPVVGLQKDEPLATGKEGAAIHGVVEPAVAPAVDGEMRKRVGDLERSVGRAAIHDQVLALDPLHHSAADGILKRRRCVKRGSDDGKERGCG